MLRFLALTIFELVLCGIAAAQVEVPPNCPSIELFGPAGIVQPGEIGRYTVNIGKNGQDLNLKYFWSTSAGEIASGQGTPRVEVKWPFNSLVTVTVEVKGLSKGCPTTASESASAGNQPPLPVKLAQFRGPSFKEDKSLSEKISQAIKDYPNDQFYVIVGYKQNTDEELIRARERKVVEFLLNSTPEINTDHTRMTVLRYPGSFDIIEIWRIPPGAENPQCEECIKSEKGTECPSVSVTAPAGISEPGEIIYFKTEISDKLDYGTQLDWSVDNGVIVSGQNTLLLGVRMPEYPKVVATLKIQGLPKECPSKFSAEYSYVIDPGPINIGEIPSSSSFVKRAILGQIKRLMSEHPNSQLFIGAQFPLGTSAKIMESRKRWLIKTITFEKIEPSRITVVLAANDKRVIEFWLIRPGVENPTIDP